VNKEKFMNCKYVENNIIDYLEGKVSEKERTEIENHLIGCEKCRMLVKELSSVWNYVVSPAESELSPYFWTKLHRKILEYERPKAWSIFENPIKYLKPVAYGVLFAVGIFFGYELGDSYVSEEMSGYLEEFDENIYLDIFDEVPEGSIGDAYINFHNEL